MGSKRAVTSHKHWSDKRVITVCTKTSWRHSKFRICVTQTRNPLMQAFPYAKFLDDSATTEIKKRGITTLHRSTGNDIQKMLDQKCTMVKSPSIYY
jgi:hypothetical protein